MTAIIIRKVRSDEYAITRELVDEAFKPEDVMTFLDALRADGCILGEWLAEVEGTVVGHIAFSRVWVDQADGSRVDAAILTPLAVRPDYQRKGIGTKLTNQSLAELELHGETLFFVLGHPEYYPRLGFHSASAQIIDSKWPNEPAFMVRGTVTPNSRLALPAVIADAH